MKKADKEKLISKSITITTVLLLIMFGMYLVNSGYEDPIRMAGKMSGITLVMSCIFFVTAIVFVFIGFIKNQKLFEVGAWFAGLAVITLLLKIHHEIGTGIAFKISHFNITIYDVAYPMALVAIALVWVLATLKIVKK